MNVMSYVRTVLTLMFCLGVTMAMAAQAQIPPAAQVLPSGFKVISEMNQPNMIMFEGTKPNVNFPKSHMDQGIRLGASWMANAMAATSVDMIAQQPEEPGGQSMGSATREEPAGKSRYRGGVITWRKVTIPWIGSGKAPDLVTWKGSWVGTGSGGLLGASISNFVGSKEEALALINGVIDKITKTR